MVDEIPLDGTRRTRIIHLAAPAEPRAGGAGAGSIPGPGSGDLLPPVRLRVLLLGFPGGNLGPEAREGFLLG